MTFGGSKLCTPPPPRAATLSPGPDRPPAAPTHAHPRGPTTERRAAAGEDHRRAGRPNRVRPLVVPLRAAGLDDCRHTRLERGAGAVGEREERVRRQHGAGDVVPVLPRLLERQRYRVDAARLAAADPDRGEVLRDNGRIRADVLADAPCEDQVAPGPLVGLAAYDLHPLAV